MFNSRSLETRRRAQLATASMLGALTALSLSSGVARAASCESLAGKTFGVASITAASNVAPPFSVPNLDPPTPIAVNVPMCRVQGVIKPSADSDIKFEVWLPPEAAWNSKYEGIGDGGFAGSLIYGSMEWALEGGYALSGTDTGHVGGGHRHVAGERASFILSQREFSRSRGRLAPSVHG